MNNIFIQNITLPKRLILVPRLLHPSTEPRGNFAGVQLDELSLSEEFLWATAKRSRFHCYLQIKGKSGQIAILFSSFLSIEPKLIIIHLGENVNTKPSAQKVRFGLTAPFFLVYVIFSTDFQVISRWKLPFLLPAAVCRYFDGAQQL